MKKYLIKKKAVEESDSELSVEEIKPPIKKAAVEKKPKASVGRKRKLPVRLDASSSSSDSEEEVVVEKPAPRPKRFAVTAAALAGTLMHLILLMRLILLFQSLLCLQLLL